MAAGAGAAVRRVRLKPEALRRTAERWAASLAARRPLARLRDRPAADMLLCRSGLWARWLLTHSRL